MAGGGVTLENALDARYFITREILVSTAIGLSSTEKVGTLFSIVGGCSYYFLRGPGHQLSPFVGGAFGVVSFSPSAANVDSSTGTLFLLGGGLEYFFNQSFSIQVSEGLQLSTKPTNFAFVTRLGLTLFIQDWPVSRPDATELRRHHSSVLRGTLARAWHVPPVLAPVGTLGDPSVLAFQVLVDPAQTGKIVEIPGLRGSWRYWIIGHGARTSRDPWGKASGDPHLGEVHESPSFRSGTRAVSLVPGSVRADDTALSCVSLVSTALIGAGWGSWRRPEGPAEPGAFSISRPRSGDAHKRIESSARALPRSGGGPESSPPRRTPREPGGSPGVTCEIVVRAHWS